MQKNFYNAGYTPSLYFWRDRSKEVDCIIDYGTKSYPVEIKAGKTFSIYMFQSVDYWNSLAEADPKNGYLIYGGNDHWSLKKGTVVPWSQTYSIIASMMERKR